ncbi:hypothetical protein C5Y96_11770 [Blastopirellula marina]|uniref:Uncharacterized protein n=1 Tax=Blastopirellula marina TaxID=124 RepID=A0A2S8FG28_9BACT|nr:MULTISPECIES: hypothetical protein [Pirellulaceae]PQO31030.1 hypothetical protein C5Y96_11770 [Blastopirellula marina]RCS51424.1 hypothetical protein DTL36_11780 [Bremerella cremea]
MSTNPAQHESPGIQVPTVIVRAEKTFLCTACGTLVEIPADVVGQLSYATKHSPPPTDPPQDAPAGPTFNVFPVFVVDHAPRPQPKASRPPSPKRPQTPPRKTFQGRLIDGLTVPSGRQLDQAFKWISFHLKVLDRQGTEIKRLKKRIQTNTPAKVPCPHPRGHSKQETAQQPPRPPQCEEETHAHEEMSRAPSAPRLKERGPP